ncbi:MAG: class I SAM-dependent methyltransferase [Candidatus Pacebacteria bacterium]|nr:class I SAM-dependent methyltransferase [Candidatus Paceibacterota bacterium]NUQ57064.1 class I SAM-dependent methyltransferase [Candidatus Paceibacter sp.]
MKIPKKQNIQQTNPEDPTKRYYQPILRHFYLKRLKMALSCLPDKEKYGAILDIGYGGGIFFPELYRRCEKLYGIDTFGEDGKTKVRNMMAKEKINAEIITGNMTKTPFPDDFFNAVFCISALEHLEPDELERAILEIKRITKDNGLIILGFPSGRKLMQAYCMLVQRNLRFDFHRSSHELIIKNANNHLKIEEVKSFFKFIPIYYVLKCRK